MWSGIINVSKHFLLNAINWPYLRWCKGNVKWNTRRNNFNSNAWWTFINFLAQFCSKLIHCCQTIFWWGWLILKYNKHLRNTGNIIITTEEISWISQNSKDIVLPFSSLLVCAISEGSTLNGRSTPKYQFSLYSRVI